MSRGSGNRGRTGNSEIATRECLIIEESAVDDREILDGNVGVQLRAVEYLAIWIPGNRDVVVSVWHGLRIQSALVLQLPVVRFWLPSPTQAELVCADAWERSTARAKSCEQKAKGFHIKQCEMAGRKRTSTGDFFLCFPASIC